jgi:hypothetical protein
VYLPHGAIMDRWTPKTEGAGFEFSPILKPLEPFRDQLDIVSGLGHRAADSTAVHSLSPTTWLSGVRPKPTQGVDAYAGITADQMPPSASDRSCRRRSSWRRGSGRSDGACDRVRITARCRRTPTTPMPMRRINRGRYRTMFGQGARQRSARPHGEDRSVLDAITKQINGLYSLGPKDRTPNDYLEMSGNCWQIRSRNGSSRSTSIARRWSGFPSRSTSTSS